MTEKSRPGDDAEERGVREHGAGRLAVALGVAARRRAPASRRSMALRLPPKSHTRMSDGRSAACPFDDSGQGRREKKTTSISLTTLCESIANTVGIASRRIVQ